jgi:hypothetical protein
MEKFELLNNFEKAAESFKKVEELTISGPLSDYINNWVQEESFFRDICDVNFEPELDDDGGAVYKIPGGGDDDAFNPIWTLPSLSYIADTTVELKGTVSVPIFCVSAAQDWLYKYMKDKREDIIMRAGRKVAKALVEYEEEAGWRTIIPSVTSAFGGAGIVPPQPANIYQLPEGDPASGYFSKELINRLIVGAQRNGKNLTMLWISPEDMADIREYTDTDVDPITRRSIFMAAGLGSIWSIKFRVLNNLGVRGKYNIDGHTSKFGPLQANDKGSYNDYSIKHPNIIEENGTLQLAGETQVYAFASDIKDVFKLPIPEKFIARWDPMLTRRQRAGFYGWQYMGMALLARNSVYMGVVDRYFHDNRSNIKKGV